MCPPHPLLFLQTVSCSSEGGLQCRLASVKVSWPPESIYRQGVQPVGVIV